MQTESQSIDRISKVPQPPRLPHPVRITEQTWPEGTVPVVTIKCITYQHVNFIRDAIEGFLMQETTFPVEILIHDDASTDGTADIVREYQAKYPQLIRTVVQTENQWSKGRLPRSVLGPMARGEFVSYCEGDDYWISPQKLQKQVEFFHANPDALMCGCRSYVLRFGDRTPYDIVPNHHPDEFEHFKPYDLITCKWYFKTLTRMIPKQVAQEISELPNKPKFMDWPSVIQCALRSRNDPSKVGFIDEVVAVYREHSGGVWTGSSAVSKHKADIEVLQFSLLHGGAECATANDIIRRMLYGNFLALSRVRSLPLVERISHSLELFKLAPLHKAVVAQLRFVSMLLHAAVRRFLWFLKS
jgi:glycosyltransferase involved in cell wall biosynthesis